MIRWAIKLAEFNINIEHKMFSQNVVVDALSRNPQGLDVESKNKVSCNVFPSVGIPSRNKLIEEQRKYPVFEKKILLS